MAPVAYLYPVPLGENVAAAGTPRRAPGAGGVLAAIENSAALASPRSAAKRVRLAAPGPGSPGTPSQPQRGPIEDPLTQELAAARELLRAPAADGVSAPLGREAQHARLVSVVEAFAEAGQGEALYVSGLPGTGKSHTVGRALRALDFAPDVSTLWINCMAVSGAGEIYGRILDALAGGGSVGAGGKRGGGGGFAPAEAPAGARSATYEQLVAALSGRSAGSSLSSGSGSFSSSGSFGTAGSAGSSSGSKRRRGAGGGSGGGSRKGAGGQRVAIVLDEVDALVDKGQQVKALCECRAAQNGMLMRPGHTHASAD
jgi:hypothetical protein